MEVATLESVRYHNELRVARAREWIGGMFFLIALAMLLFSVGVAVMMSYVLPLRRFATMFPSLESQKFCTGIYSVLISGLYFLISVTAGMTGWLVMSGLILLWALILILIGAIRRVLHRKREKQRIKDVEGEIEAEEKENEELKDSQQEDLKGSQYRKPSVAFADPKAKKDDEPVAFGFGGDMSFDVADSAAFNNSQANFDSQANFESATFEPAAHDNSGSNGPSRRGTQRPSRMGLSDSAARGKRRLRGLNRWTYCPERVSSGQTGCFLISMITFILITAILLILVYAWDIKEYKILRSGTEVTEFQPGIAAKALQFMYAFPELATTLRLQLYVKWFTEYCGRTYTKQLSGGDKASEIKENWIDKYSINMTLFREPDFNKYTSVNDWFIRAIKDEYRRAPAGTNHVLSPADCRLLVYNNPGDVRIWLKGYSIDYNDLLDNQLVSGSARYFDGGSMVIARLAPQDYHRFHSPVTGQVKSIRQVTSTYWSVSADGARSGNNAFLNTRTVVLIDAGPRIGMVAYIGIGATCVGSVKLENEKDGSTGALTPLEVGTQLSAGDLMGTMNFGGSTVVVLFAQGRVLFNDDLVRRSRYAVETLTNVRESIGFSR